ncbi:MAG: Lon-like protease helical domain-containing protein [Burkholderiaceae bacterium]
MRRDGYHLFVMGPRGIGKTRFVREAIHRHGARSERGDWVYVNHFERPERPLALGLPAGVGTQLRDDMRHLVDELKAMIPAAFEAESYAAEVERIQSDIGERHGKALSALNEEANQDGIALVQTLNGFSLAPMADGEVMPPDAFAKLPEDEQKRLRERIVALQEKLARIMREGMRLRKEQAERVRALNRESHHDGRGPGHRRAGRALCPAREGGAVARGSARRRARERGRVPARQQPRRRSRTRSRRRRTSAATRSTCSARPRTTSPRPWSRPSIRRFRYCSGASTTACRWAT